MRKAIMVWAAACLLAMSSYGDANRVRQQGKKQRMQPMTITSIEPTVFFTRQGNGLRQLVRVNLENTGEARESSLRVHTDGVDESLSLGLVAPGKTECEVFVPDIRRSVEVSFALLSDGAVQDEKSIRWTPQRHWEVHLIQYAHHDMGYTDLPSEVLEEYMGFYDQVIQFCEETEDWADDSAKFRYQCEQAWSLVHYIENRPKEVVERLVHFIKNGQIEVPALFGNEILELCGHEELIRLLYPSFRLKREFGIDIGPALLADIPGLSWGLASVLAGIGQRYFVLAMPIWYFRGVHPLWDLEKALPIGVDRPAACWWEGPDGARVLLWAPMHGVGEWHPYSFEQAMHDLPAKLASLEEDDYAYDMMSYTLRGGAYDNAPPTLRFAHMAKEWNERWAYPRLINTTYKPFLEEFEKRWGDTLKTLRGDVPGTDYSVAATCTPKETAVDRNTHDALLRAEKLSTLAGLVSEYEYPGAVIDEAYRETFYYDLHCWGYMDPGGPAQDATWSEKANHAYRAAALSHRLTLNAANRIVDEIAYPKDPSQEGDVYYFTVFNSLSHERTDVVRVPMRTWAPGGGHPYWWEPKDADRWPLLVLGSAVGRHIVTPPYSLFEQPFELVDVDTGEGVPYQLATLDDPQAAVPWAPERVAMGKIDPRHLSEVVFVAEKLPEMGYRTYKIVPCEQWPVFAAPVAVAKSESGHVMENSFYKLHLDPGNRVIASLFDKDLGQELVDAEAPHGFAQMIVRSAETAEEELIRITGMSVSEAGPVYTTARLKGETSCSPRVTIEVTLYHTLKRVDVNARLLTDSTPAREIYFAFPFLIEDPQFRFEAVDSVIEPIRDQWPGSNTDYYAVQHWADVFNDEMGVVWAPVDTPMAEFGGLWPGYVSRAHHGVTGPDYGHPFLQPGELTRGHIYSMVSYGNFRTNFINSHPSEYVVRYSFSAHRGDWRGGRAREFGWNVANPPLAVWMRQPLAGPKDGSLPTTASFCQVDAPNVMLLTLKRAEDGDGTILRLIETEGESAKTTVTIPYLSISRAFETNSVEENQRELPCTTHSLETTLKPFSIATIRLVTER